MTIAVTNPLAAGSVINKQYEIIKLLGQGGCGRTYLVKHTKSRDQWALKEFVPADINQSTKNQKKAKKLFIREANTLARLDHPQIPKFKDSFEEDGRLFLVQEFVDGDNYWALLGKRKTFSEAEVTDILRDLLPVLSYIHTEGLIHRDISPDNIMVPHDGSKPKLIDFGIVGQVVTQLQTKPSGQSSQQISRTRAGKERYAAPEQMRTGECYPSSDLYALAVTMLVLLTGKSVNELFDGYKQEWKWRSYVTVSDRLGLILDNLLENVPDKRRYKSADIATNCRE